MPIASTSQEPAAGIHNDRPMNALRLRSPVTIAALALATGLLPSTAKADPPKVQGQHFTIDPVADGVLTAGGAGISGLLGLILGTGEIQATPPTSRDHLLSIDRIAVDQTIDPNASTYSDIILWSAVGFAGLDSILSGIRDGWDAALVDAVMYAESLSLTLAFTDVTKIAVRRPRPLDYQLCEGKSSTDCLNNTDLDLSFFSGHSSTVAAVSATATYLAFVRSPNTPRPWITLGAGVLLTTFVSYERVRSGAHFPTDVMAGSMAGAAIGILVPHLHRHHEEAPPVWVGLAPAPRGSGGALTLEGFF